VDSEGFVPMQGLLVAVIGPLAALICGPEAAQPVFWVLVVGIVGWLALLTQYSVRSKGRRTPWRRGEDQKVAALTSFAFGIGIIVTMAVWWFAGQDFGPASNSTASFTATLITIALVAIYVSSLIDWYVIVPFVFGFVGLPIWVLDKSGRAESARRRHTMIWVVHRGLCELVSLSCFALILAIGMVALVNLFASNGTLPTAIESLGGAGIAFAVIGYRGPEMKGAIEFALSGPIGLGTWVRKEEPLRTFEGYVVDVSIHPGFKLVDKEGVRKFVSLANSPELSSSDRPEGIDDAWCEQIVLKHFRKNPEHEAKED
jgi:hypothetical protein